MSCNRSEMLCWLPLSGSDLSSRRLCLYLRAKIHLFELGKVAMTVDKGIDMFDNTLNLNCLNL